MPHAPFSNSHIKTIYLARRNPALSPTAYTIRWREHGALAMGLPIWANMVRYAQCDMLHEHAPAFGASTGYDGVGLVWYRNAAALQAIADKPALRAPLLEDEPKVFDGLVRDFAILTREAILLDAGYGPIKIIRFIQTEAYPNEKAIAGLLDKQAAMIAGAAQECAGLCGYRLDFAIGNAYTANSRLPFQLVSELNFRRLDDAMAARDGGLLVRLDASIKGQREVTLLTLEQPMYDTAASGYEDQTC
ncbi:EthD domain-containing protein [Ferrovibrio sp.]|uniref:EthD domain-containing protein n=1 Tax=Ferrovibrio sp. TaxID=1917215 RepID=UPI0035B3D1A1